MGRHRAPMSSGLRKKATLNLLWMAFGSSEVHRVKDVCDTDPILRPIQMTPFLHPIPALGVLKIVQGILQRETVLPLHRSKYAIELFFYRVVNAVA